MTLRLKLWASSVRRWTLSAAGAEALATAAALAASALHAFQRSAGDGPHTYFVFPPIVWAALRFGTPGAALGTGLIAAVAVARMGEGPFAGQPWALAGFLTVTALCALALSTCLDQLDRARRQATDDRNRLEAALNRMPAVLWTVDREMRFTFMRGTLLGRPITDGAGIVGLTLPAFFHTDDPSFPALVAHREALAGQPADYKQEWEGVLYQCHVDPLRRPDGVVTGAMGVAQDVTREQAAEEGRRRAQKLDALSRLAGRAAHDFNNALTAIMGHCDLVLADTAEDDPRRADVRAIEKSAQGAAATAERLTVLSRHRMNDLRPVDLNAFLQQSDGELSKALGAGVSRVYRLEPGLPLVRVDLTQLREIIKRLADNAKDAMGGTGQLVLATSRRRSAGAESRPAADGTHARLTVSDTGPGLSPEALAHLFEPFFSTKSRAKDRGLGLATCYGLVRQNDGAITVASEPGKGTSVHIDFPLWTGGSPEDERPQPRADAGPAPRGSEALVLVDDEDTVREPLARALRGLGYEVIEAPGGREALALLDEGAGTRVRLLLSDVSMPGMNGVELAAETARRHPGLRRLLMSGYAEASLLKEGSLPPGTAFLQKPFPSAVLARRVRELLDVPLRPTC